jgi:hypothetical protein
VMMTSSPDSTLSRSSLKCALARARLIVSMTIHL